MTPFTEGRQPYVLVVDDEPDMLAFFKAVLENQGYRVDCAENGSEADFKLNRAQYDVIITDLNMPYTDGATFIKNLRNSITNHRTPVIVISGFLSKQAILKLAKSGVTKIFSKPVETQKFITGVNEAIEYQSDLSKLDDLRLANPAPKAQEAAEEPEEFEVSTEAARK